MGMGRVSGRDDMLSRCHARERIVKERGPVRRRRDPLRRRGRGATGAVTVSAELLYQSVSYRFADDPSRDGTAEG